MNSNATLKIPREGSGSEALEVRALGEERKHPEEVQRTTQNSKEREQKAQRKPERDWQERTKEHESLILAQDERWRRA